MQSYDGNRIYLAKLHQSFTYLQAEDRRKRLLSRRNGDAHNSRKTFFYITQNDYLYLEMEMIDVKLSFLPSSRSPLAGHGPGRDALKTTMMLIVLIAVFLSTEIPFMVITVLHVLSTRSVLELQTNHCIGEVFTIAEKANYYKGQVALRIYANKQNHPSHLSLCQHISISRLLTMG